MIVSCQSCNSRYKLDDAKVSGHGAKITCPRCKHVFVVYAQPVVSSAGSSSASVTRAHFPGTAAFTGGPPRPQTPIPSAWEDQPTRVGGANGESRAVDLGGGGTGSVAGPLSAVALRAATLDFRSVGVATWKVKVKIGLVYDFSDVKTLRKYILDGRVTPSDVVGWDGIEWRAIGNIPDLDAFFVDTWEQLALRKAADPAAPPLVVVEASREGASVLPPAVPLSATVMTTTAPKDTGPRLLTRILFGCLILGIAAWWFNLAYQQFYPSDSQPEAAEISPLENGG